MVVPIEVIEIWKIVKPTLEGIKKKRQIISEQYVQYTVPKSVIPSLWLSIEEQTVPIREKTLNMERLLCGVNRAYCF